MLRSSWIREFLTDGSSTPFDCNPSPTRFRFTALKRSTWKVTPSEAGLRLDKFLAARSGLSRGACRRAIEEGGVWIGGRRVRKLSLEVQAGREIALVIDERPTPFDTPVILHADDALVVLDKPAGLPSQGTLASDQHSALGWAQREIGESVRTVHRLDVGTSGVLLLARTAAAAAALSEQFREGTVEKRYLALCAGTLPADRGRLSARLRPAERRGSFETTASGGIPAETDYRVLARQPPLLLIEARPHTGRTHQIRVHLSAAGAPLIGDSRYGGPLRPSLEGAPLAATRPLLHAAELRVTHPRSGERVTFLAPPPADFEEIARRLPALAASEATQAEPSSGSSAVNSATSSSAKPRPAR